MKLNYILLSSFKIQDKTLMEQCPKCSEIKELNDFDKKT